MGKGLEKQEHRVTSLLEKVMSDEGYRDLLAQLEIDAKREREQFEASGPSPPQDDLSEAEEKIQAMCWKYLRDVQAIFGTLARERADQTRAMDLGDWLAYTGVVIRGYLGK